MTTIKIPSPSLVSMRRLAEPYAYTMTTAEMYQRYMDNVVRRLQRLTGMDFKYENLRVLADGIYVDVNVEMLHHSLPTLKDMGRVYHQMKIRAEFQQRITRVSSKGETAPAINANSLLDGEIGKRLPVIDGTFSQWPTRWITIYLWTLLGAGMSKNITGFNKGNILCDSDIANELLLELEAFEFY